MEWGREDRLFSLLNNYCLFIKEQIYTLLCNIKHGINVMHILITCSILPPSPSCSVTSPVTSLDTGIGI
jgi:hypothetical protein